MGIFSQNTNKKKKTLQKHTYRKKRLDKAAKKAAKGPAALEIPDADLFSTDMLKNKLKNPRNNIKLSNKKRKRILKRLGHQRRPVDQDEDEEEKDEEMAVVEDDMTEVTDDVSQPSTSSESTTQPKKRSRGGRKHRKGKKVAEVEDVDMKEDV